MTPDLIIRVVTIAALVLSQVLDWHSTLAFLRSGHGREGNGMLARLQKRYGASRVMVLKGLAHLPIAVLVWYGPLAVCAGLVAYFIFYWRMISKNYAIAKGKG